MLQNPKSHWAFINQMEWGMKKNTTDHYIKNSQSKIQKTKAYKTKIRKKISSFKTTTNAIQN